MPVYVNSNAAGSNDGTSWPNAYTGFVDATNDASSTGGQFIWVASEHSGQEPSEDWTTTAPNNDPLKVISVNTGTDTYETGGIIHVAAAGNVNVGGGYYLDGLHITTAATLVLGDSDTKCWFNNCEFNYGAGGANLNLEQTNASVILSNCSIVASANIRVASDVQFLGNRWNVDGGANVMESRSAPARIDILANDFSDVTPGQQIIRTNYSNDGISYMDMIMSVRADTQDLEDTNDAYHLATHNQFHHFGEESETGQTITHGFERYLHGTIRYSTGVYREEGAFDGQYNISQVVDPNSGTTNRAYQPFYTDWLYGFTDGDSSTEYTYDIHIAHSGDGDGSGGLYLNDQVWMEIFLPNNLDNTARADYITSRATPYTTNPVTGLDLITIPEDTTSTWVGASVQQRIRISHIPNKPGPMMARVGFAPGFEQTAVALYIDPYIVTGAV